MLERLVNLSNCTSSNRNGHRIFDDKLEKCRSLLFQCNTHDCDQQNIDFFLVNDYLCCILLFNQQCLVLILTEKTSHDNRKNHKNKSKVGRD